MGPTQFDSQEHYGPYPIKKIIQIPFLKSCYRVLLIKVLVFLDFPNFILIFIYFGSIWLLFVTDGTSVTP